MSTDDENHESYGAMMHRGLRDAEQPRDAVVEAVREDLLRRSQVGIKKYGVTLERTDLSLRDWLEHAYEEALDMANYLKRTIMEIDSGKD